MGRLGGLRDNDWTKILGWPGYPVFRAEIDEGAKALKLWVRRKPGNRRVVCSGCGCRVSEICVVYEREMRDRACFEYSTTVVLELYRARCPKCGVKAEKVEQLPSQAPFSKRFVGGADAGFCVGDPVTSMQSPLKALGWRARLCRRFGRSASIRSDGCATREEKRFTLLPYVPHVQEVGIAGGRNIALAFPSCTIQS